MHKRVVANEPRTTLADVNRVLARQIYRILAGQSRNSPVRGLSGDRFRTLLGAEEGLEVEGFDVYDIDQSATHLDFSRLAMPTDRLPEAILNDELMTRRFVRQVDQELLLILDVTPSMRYPLRRLYLGGQLGASRAELDRQCAGKPSLLKLMAGLFLQAALTGGYTVRCIEFDGRRMIESQQMRDRLDLGWLFTRIDRHFRFDDRQQGKAIPSPALPLDYADVASRYMRRKAVAVFLGDFLEGSYVQENARQFARALRAVRLFSHWGRTRPLTVVRINHHFEIDPPLGGANLNHPIGDRCSTDVEAHGSEPQDIDESFSESRERVEKRLERQTQWTHTLATALRRSCRRFVSIDDRSGVSGIVQCLPQMWSRLTSLPDQPNS